MDIVYYSSPTGNTKAFVDKLGFPSHRLPIKPNDDTLEVDFPYVLVVPTYGGGASMMGRKVRPVPTPVKKFLEHGENADHMVAVISGGNLNFGADYGVAGDVISRKFGVPYVYRFELRGTDRDVELCKDGITRMFG